MQQNAPSQPFLAAHQDYRVLLLLQHKPDVGIFWTILVYLFPTLKVFLLIETHPWIIQLPGHPWRLAAIATVGTAKTEFHITPCLTCGLNKTQVCSCVRENCYALRGYTIL